MTDDDGNSLAFEPPLKKATNGQDLGGNDPDSPVNGMAAGHQPAPIRPPSVVAVYLAAITLLVTAYTAVFSLTSDVGWMRSLGFAIANVLPLAMLAAGSYVILKYVVLRQGVVAQAVAHVLLAPVFAVSWYALTLVALALVDAMHTGGVEIGQFSDVAFIWQMFQGLVLYALVAAICYALRGGRTTAEVRIVQTSPTLSRYLTKHGDELVPVEVDDIVMIGGAQDYAEVTTTDGRSHLVRMSLTEFEERLPDDRFVRVHRSTIINIAHLGRAEPLGSGRLALHLAGGLTVEASRSGAQALRSLVL
ncbi:MAG: LytTR family transcriptional regulator [Sphingopyxis sp.]|nr:LytTR family transcriptional regulator [Sphingopyxis sp.]